MNFDYIREAVPETEELKQLYASLYASLEEAENTYWIQPQKAGRNLREAAEKICNIYNRCYEIGFEKNTSLEEYLCYTDKEAHNVMVSRFLSVVRQEQRDRLEWIRVMGDECIYLEQNPDKIPENSDRLYLDVKKMMIHMLNTTREMCEKINRMTGLENCVFEEQILPGYVSEDERQKQEKEEKRKSRHWFWK